MFTKAVIHLRILRHGTRIKLGKHSLRIVRFYYILYMSESESWLINE